MRGGLQRVAGRHRAGASRAAAAAAGGTVLALAVVGAGALAVVLVGTTPVVVTEARGSALVAAATDGASRVLLASVAHAADAAHDADGPGTRRAVRDGARPREWRLGDDVLVTELARGVWRHTSWSVLDGKRVPANGLVVRDGDEIVLIDTAWGEEPTAVLLDWIERELGRPVSRAIATHSHEDRVGAPRTLAARGIPLLVHPRTAALAARRGVTTTQPITGFASADAVTLGGIEVFHPGPGHAPDNVVVWMPHARLLFGGCAVKSADATDLGFVGDADVARWPDAMRALHRRYPDMAIVVPGHGDPGDPSLVQHTIDLLAAYEGAASTSRGEGARAVPPEMQHREGATR